MRYIVLMLFLSTGCTSSVQERFSSYGSEHTVTCYSGNTIIYKGISTGKVASEANSDGFYFEDKDTGKLVEVSGNCVIIRK